MKAKLMSLFMAMAITITTLTYSSNSHAIVGLIAKSKTVKTIGGIGAAGGAGFFGYGLLVAKGIVVPAGSALGVALVTLSMGIMLGGIGLLVLDEKVAVDFEFTTLDSKSVTGVTDYEIAIFNQELEMLNAVNRTIQAELTEEDGPEMAQALWEDYKLSLSPETAKVAEAAAAMFMKDVENKLR
jgi:hypothetical protein